MVPAMMPPPTPMKLLTLAAGTFEMRIPLFMSAIVLGRVLRFILLTTLLVTFGPEKLRQFARGFIDHWPLISFAIFALAVLVIIFWRVRSRVASAAK
jgi:membrane protein DedA with SNARE-associated domain